MASILSLRPRLFQTRNTARDTHTDLDRLMRVRRSIADAIEDAGRERRGLQQRLDVYYAQAANMLDNSSEYGARSPEDEKVIVDAEANAAAANQRIAQIDEQVVTLSAMLAELDQSVDGPAA
jgi:chromosome segregation ATPase